MGNLYVDYASLSADTDRGRSPGLWKGSHWDEILGGNHTIGRHWGDEFPETPITATNGYTLYEADDKADWSPVITGDDGGVALVMTGDDHEEGNLIYSIDNSIIDDIDTNSSFELYFEARWKVSSVTDDYIAAYVGLAEANLKGNAALADNTGIIALNDYLMHRTLHVNAGTTGLNAKLDAVFATSGGAEVTAITAQKTLVGDTFVKTGFRFNGKTKVEYFIDGVASPTTTSPAATNFPNSEKLTFACGAKLGDGTAATFTLAWWHCIIHKPSARS